MWSHGPKRFELAVRGWLILVATLLAGVILGIGAATMGPAVVAPYLPKSMSGSSGWPLRSRRAGKTRLNGSAIVVCGEKWPGCLPRVEECFRKL
jgi:hypothetical protein